MSDINQLNDEELEKVTGGKRGTEDPEDSGFSGFVNMYSVQEGSMYFFVYYSGSHVHWIYGKLLKTWEEDVGFGRTQRRHQIEVFDCNFAGCDKGQITTKSGDSTAVYTNKN